MPEITDFKDRVVIPCPQGYCSEHPHTLERIAMIEKGLEVVETNSREVKEALEKLRETISNGILNRYPSTIIWIISILTGFCTSLLTVVLGRFLGK